MKGHLNVLLGFSLVVSGCRTTIYVSDPAQLPPGTRSRIAPDSSQVSALVSATPAILDRLARGRRVTGEVLTALTERNGAVLATRYGLRSDRPQAAALLALVDRRSGPPALDLRIEADPAERVVGAMTVLGVVLRVRYRGMAGREISQRVALDIYCLERAGTLEVVELVPTMTELATR